MNWNDKRMETVIGLMLRTGVMLAAAIVLTGGVLYLFQNHGPRPDYRQFHGEPHRLMDFGSIAQGVGAGDARSIIMFGLLVLIATPVARVAMCVVGFLLEHDKLYVTISTIVLAILVYSLFFHR